MTKQILSTLKVLALALVLSIGLSYVYAWTAPTQTPPGGNVSAPINTSATAQTKAGGLTVGTITASTHCIGASCITAWPTGSGSAYSAGYGLALSGTTFTINQNQAQSRVSGTCAVGSSIRVVNSDGTVSCQTDNVGGGGGAFYYVMTIFSGMGSGFCYSNLYPCKPNPKTGNYSCPAGFTAVGGITGQVPHNNGWVSSVYYYTCV